MSVSENDHSTHPAHYPSSHPQTLPAQNIAPAAPACAEQNAATPAAAQNVAPAAAQHAAAQSPASSGNAASRGNAACATSSNDSSACAAAVHRTAPAHEGLTPDTSWDIELRDLRLGYGETVVLDNVSDVFPGGRITAILGGSGCGKSTLLRHILGLRKPMSGHIYLDGQDIFTMPEKEFRRMRRRMGVLFQDGALLGALTLGENVGLPLSEHTKLSRSAIREVVHYKLSLVGLEDFADYYPNELSGGMRKRAGLARALVMDPPLLLCDEPTSGLDPINAAQMDQLLLDLKQEFPVMTIVTVSHDLASVKAIADHVLMLHDKSVVFAGTKDELYASSAPYVRRFLHREHLSGKSSGLQLSPEIKAELERQLFR